MAGFNYKVTFAPGFESILKKLKSKKPDLFRDLHKYIKKITREPTLGKPLRNILRNYRRVQVGSFVLIYEILGSVVRLHDFDHHNRIYKKYS